MDTEAIKDSVLGHAAMLDARLEDDRGDDRPALEQIDAMLLAWTIAHPPTLHKRRRPAAVEIDRVFDAEVHKRLRELGNRHPGVATGAPVTRHGEKLPTSPRERGTRMAPIIDIGVELARTRREPLRVRVTGNCAAASRDKQRPSLQKVTGRRDRQRIATRNVHILVDM
jgi:hypothetical protein